MRANVTPRRGGCAAVRLCLHAACRRRGGDLRQVVTCVHVGGQQAQDYHKNVFWHGFKIDGAGYNVVPPTIVIEGVSSGA
jgi:hypothetical protein